MTYATKAHRPDTPPVAQKGLQFDRGTVERRRSEGLADAEASPVAAPLTQPVSDDVSFRSSEVLAPASAQQSEP